MNELIDKLNRAIDYEYDSKNSEVDDLMLLPLDKRIIKGETINDATADFSYFSNRVLDGEIVFTQVRILCKNNISKLRPGSAVFLEGNGKNFKLDVLEDNNDEIILEVGFGVGVIDKSLDRLSGWQINPAKVDIRDIVKKTTILLSSNPSKFKYLSDIFTGTSFPEFDNSRLNIADQLIAKSTLNQSQQEAFKKAYAAKNYFLIQGPPGSGKTWLLAHLAVAFAKEGKKVLITANTHTAINNALQKCSALSGYPHVIKVGKKYQMENLNQNGSNVVNVTDFRRADYDNNSRGIIVGATCYSPHTRKLEFMDWDVILIDEAGQLSVTLAFAAMVKGEQYIFIGDHKQLPPIVSGNKENIEFSTSIFEHLFQYAPGVMLNVTYRMNKEINNFPSQAFYQNTLQPHPDNENWRLNIPNNFGKHPEILDKELPEVLYCHYHPSNYSISEYEANLISEFVEEYILQGVNPEEIAIITPFRQQVRQINKALSRLNDYQSIKEKLFVDTVERIQGQERDVIIYSLVVSDPEKALHRPDFFFSPNRFNVAITRAKKKRIVVANKALFELYSQDPEIDKMIAVFRSFYDQSTKVFEKANTEDLF